MGDALLQKQYTTESLPRQKKNNNGERDMLYIENFNPAIISREVYNKANELREDSREQCKNTIPAEERIRTAGIHREDGKVMGSNRKQSFGYTMDFGHIVIHQEEAKWVMQIFLRYNRASFKELAEMMQKTDVSYDMDKPWNLI